MAYTLSRSELRRRLFIALFCVRYQCNTKANRDTLTVLQRCPCDTASSISLLSSSCSTYTQPDTRGHSRAGGGRGICMLTDSTLFLLTRTLARGNPPRVKSAQDSTKGQECPRIHQGARVG